MSASCCQHTPEPASGVDRNIRVVLWIALAINLGMFAVEIGASIVAGSSALQADALDFLGDAGNYGISLFVVIIASLNLIIDFDMIENGARMGAPKYMEWYGAFGLMVTLIWLYMEMLRLLSKVRRR